MSDSPDEDASVCYRHPGRQSWILCQRCGRTICPECQIQAPVGVQCPECVAEANGGSGPRWMPTSAPPNNVTAMRRKPKWRQWASRFLRPDSEAPIVTWVVLGALAVVSLASFLVPAVALALVAFPDGSAWQIWRFFTSALIAPSILGLVLNIVFFVLIGPTVERMMGRQRFATVLAAGAAVGASAMLLSGSAAFGISGAMFGMFAAYFVIARSMGANMTQFLVIMGLNFVLTLVLSPQFIFMLVGGLLGGGGAAWLFFHHRDKGTKDARQPYLQIAAGVGAVMLLAVLRSLVIG